MQAMALERVVVARQVVAGEARRSPATLELCLRVPPSTAAVLLRLDFQKAFLTVYEHPPDASRSANGGKSCSASVLDAAAPHTLSCSVFL